MCQSSSLGFVATTWSFVAVVVLLFTVVAVFAFALCSVQSLGFQCRSPSSSPASQTVSCSKSRGKFSGSLEPRVPVCIL